jgi:hypothetical protein
MIALVSSHVLALVVSVVDSREALYQQFGAKS